METTLYFFLITVFGFLFLYSVFSRIVKHYISPILLVMLLGIIISPNALNLMPKLADLPMEKMFEQICRLTLAVGLLGVAMRITPQNFRNIWKSGLTLIILAMFSMWAVSSLLVHLILQLNWVYSLLVAAIITPTDPIVASSIVTGGFARKNIDDKIRKLISLESGANDGLAYLFVMIPILILQYQNTAQAFSRWFFNIFLWQVAAVSFIGLAVGVLAGLFFRLAKNRNLAEEAGLLIYTVAFSIIVMALAKLLNTDAVWTVFVAGIVFNHFIKSEERIQEDDLQEASNLVLTFPLFFLFGYFLPWQAWTHVFGLKLLLIFAAAILLLRRLPLMMLYYKSIKLMNNWKQAMFIGWFGPIGVSALFYASMALKRTQNNQLYLAATFIIFSSVVIHGLTAAPFTWIYGKKARRPDTIGG